MPVLLTTDGVAIDCPAKVNLTLAVAPPRDDGYHPIASVMAALAFGDRLVVNPVAHGPSRFVRRWDPGRFNLSDADPPVQPIDWPIERDLIYKAHAQVQQAVGYPLLIECGLDKRIPAGAGMGGGSSNAAGMLVAMREVFDLDLPDAQLLEIAACLGADASFALHALLGRPAAVVTGVGEVVQPMTLPAADIVLVKPEGACPTGAVYQAFDEAVARGRGQAQSDQALGALAAQWRTADTLPAPQNDLAPAACTVCPAIEAARAALEGLGHTAHLTGSGSALFVYAQGPVEAQAIAGAARGLGLWSVATTLLAGD